MPPFTPLPDGVTDQELKRGYWWLTHRDLVKRAGTALFAVVAVALVLYGGWGFIDWYFGSGVRERAGVAALLKEVTNFSAFRVANAPNALSVTAPIVLSNSGTYDVVATVTNSSLKWWATFQYQFAGVGDQTAKPLTAFILPGETKSIASLGVKGVSSGSPSLNITNLQWYRVNNRIVQPDYLSWARSRLNFLVSKVVFVPPAPQDTVQTSRATFTVQNDSAYGYYTTGFFITVYAGPQVVGSNSIAISDFRPGDIRQVEVVWFSPIIGVTKVDVQPIVNIFDPQAYIPPGK